MSVSQAEVVDFIKNLRLGEVKDLVSVLEDELGVMAEQGMPVIPYTPSPEWETVQTEFDVVLHSFGDKKVQVIRVVREATGLGLREAKAQVEALSVIKEGIPLHEAEELKAKLEEAGGTAEVK